MTLQKCGRFWVVPVVGVLAAFAAGSAFGGDKAGFGWPRITKECRPWTYWWWHGSSVSKEGLTEHLEAYHKAGMGGVHVIPIYGVKGEEEHFIEYLSPRWMEMLGHLTKEAERLDMGVDMSTGTGWPPGGPNVSIEDATAEVILRKYEVAGGGCLDKAVRAGDKQKLKAEHLRALMGYSDGGAIVDLTGKVGGDGRLEWTAPAGKWKLYAVFQAIGGKKVERAAPGGVGYVVDPFSTTSLRRYLERFDKAFASYDGIMPRGQYHDSYEYGHTTWTDDFFAEFERRRGYDLRWHLPAFFGEGDEDTVSRVKCDYRETISDLHLGFIRAWTQWSHEKGCVTRNQAHGSPTNLLDTYAAADIPETEIFGPSGFKIPGVRQDPYFGFHAELNNPLCLKLASSAAHVSGGKLVSSESCTWLGEHFQVALSQVKPEIDQLFLSGINHVFFHGMAYSPFDEAWPGWLFYASTNFAPSNSFWHDFPELTGYIARCQAFLQSGVPDNDVLLYWPIYDTWHGAGGLTIQNSVHGLGSWLKGGFREAAQLLWDEGYGYDYVSDRQFCDARVRSGRIELGDGRYRVVVIPECRFMPVGTLEQLVRLAKAGGTVIFHKKPPVDVPGLGDLQNRRGQFAALLNKISAEGNQAGLSRRGIGSGFVVIGSNLDDTLARCGVQKEEVMSKGVRFIRRRDEEGTIYFLANQGDKDVDEVVRFNVEGAASAVFMDGQFEDRMGTVRILRGEDPRMQCRLQLEPGESIFLRVFSSKQVSGPRWKYFEAVGEPYEIKGRWQVHFVQGGPVLPGDFETDRLASWTELGDSEAKRFAGTGRYKIDFEKPAAKADDWILELGDVRDSARVTLNGRYVGVVWSVPFKIAVGKFLREGKNELDVEVTNLSANRIADLDRRKVNWKKFYEINFVNIDYHKFDASGWPLMDSGLLGPVRLVGVDVRD